MKTPKLLALGSLVALLIMGALFQSQGMPIGGAIAGLTSSSTAVTFDRPALFPNGTATAPAWGWASDNDGTGTGAYRPGANEIMFVLNSTPRLSLTSNQVDPGADNTSDLGQTARRWRNMYSMGLNVGTSGTTLARLHSGTATIDFADRAGVFGCEEAPITCTGATTANTSGCTAAGSAAPTDGDITCRVSAADTCQARYCGTGNPASMTVRAVVFGF